jgi:hypothetical protein
MLFSWCRTLRPIFSRWTSQRLPRDTLGRSAPVDDVGFVDFVARLVGGREALGRD